MGQIATITIGSDNFSVYSISADPIADATAFFNGLLGAGATAWGAATSDNRKRALVTAADWIDRALNFSGKKTVSTQARAWPRDGAVCGTETVADGSVPDNVARAQFFLAGAVLSDSSLATGTGTGANIRRAQAGSASVEFFRPTQGTAFDTRLPIAAMDYVKCYLGGSSSLAAGVAYGTGSESAFSDTDFTRSEGFF